MRAEIKSWKELIDHFFYMSQIQGKCKKTLDWYRNTIIPFTRSVPFENLSIQGITDYIQSLWSRGLKPTSVDNHVRAIKAFLNFLYTEGLIKENYSSQIPKIKLPKQRPFILTDDQVASILRACDKKSWIGFRNYVIVLTFLDTGIRLSELLRLTVYDIDLTMKSIRVREGKGNKEREIYMGRTLAREMAKWLKMRGYLPHEDALFITQSGAPLKKRHVEAIVEKLGEKAGIKGVRCSPHTFRHTFATNFIRNGGDVFTLQKILGHSDVSTCMIYVHMSGKHIQTAMLKYSPIDRFFE